MPNVFQSGKMLPELRGTVRGGLAVTLHDPAEIDGLTALFRLTPRPPEDPMTAIYRALADPTLDLAAWATHWRDLRELDSVATPTASTPPTPLAIQNSEDPEESFPAGKLGQLIVALEAARELWYAQGSEAPLLSFVGLFAEPGTATQGDLVLEGEGAALVIRPGSLLGAVVRLPVRVTSFALCLVAGGGTSTGARRTEMVSRLRTQAAAGALPLRDIRTEPRPAPGVGRNRPLAVLVHGLFATDVGTFGPLQTRLEKDFDVFGFPHDTLSESIDANGVELAKQLATLGYSKICCVAHSRGGLVARSAAVHLAKHSSNDLKIARCATFGTPHLGAAMAENPGSLIASIAFLKAGMADRSVASVLDMLACVSELGEFPGIRDLRPASVEATWLSRFLADEGLFPDAKMTLFAVGGERRPVGLMQRIAGFSSSRIIGRVPSDLVVPQASSLPLLSNKGSQSHKVFCDHFSYFTEDQAATLDKAVEFLRQ